MMVYSWLCHLVPRKIERKRRLKHDSYVEFSFGFLSFLRLYRWWSIKRDSAKRDSARSDSAKRDSAKRDSARSVSARSDSARSDSARSDSAKC